MYIWLFLSWDVETSKSKGSDFGSPREVFFDFLTSKIKQPISRLESYEIPMCTEYRWRNSLECGLQFFASLCKTRQQMYHEKIIHGKSSVTSASNCNDYLIS